MRWGNRWGNRKKARQRHNPNDDLFRGDQNQRHGSRQYYEHDEPDFTATFKSLLSIIPLVMQMVLDTLFPKTASPEEDWSFRGIHIRRALLLILL